MPEKHSTEVIRIPKSKLVGNFADRKLRGRQQISSAGQSHFLQEVHDRLLVAPAKNDPHRPDRHPEGGGEAVDRPVLRVVMLNERPNPLCDVASTGPKANQAPDPVEELCDGKRFVDTVAGARRRAMTISFVPKPLISTTGTSLFARRRSRNDKPFSSRRTTSRMMRSTVSEASTQSALAASPAGRTWNSGDSAASIASRSARSSSTRRMRRLRVSPGADMRIHSWARLARGATTGTLVGWGQGVARSDLRLTTAAAAPGSPGSSSVLGGTWRPWRRR